MIWGLGGPWSRLSVRACGACDGRDGIRRQDAVRCYTDDCSPPPSEASPWMVSLVPRRRRSGGYCAPGLTMDAKDTRIDTSPSCLPTTTCRGLTTVLTLDVIEGVGVPYGERNNGYATMRGAAYRRTAVPLPPLKPNPHDRCSETSRGRGQPVEVGVLHDVRQISAAGQLVTKKAERGPTFCTSRLPGRSVCAHELNSETTATATTTTTDDDRPTYATHAHKTAPPATSARAYSTENASKWL